MLKTNESAENYLETILVLSQKKPVVRCVDIAEELGFIPVNPEKENLEKVVKDATNGEGCDAFFECSGAAVPAMQMTDITRVRGKICIVSVHKKPHEVNLREVNFKEQTVVGTRVYTKELQNLQKN